jgi:tetratricopeptide (TPR) repeat protein
MGSTEDRRRRADQIFDEALDLPPTERAALLDRACGGDAGLRALIDRLLAGAESDAPALAPGGAFQGPLWEGTDPEEDGSLAAGSIVGRYRIVRERHGLAMPQIALARCLTALGRYEEAETYLQPLTADEQIDPLKDRAREALTELQRTRGTRTRPR